jgi:hypothetical protein
MRIGEEVAVYIEVHEDFERCTTPQSGGAAVFSWTLEKAGFVVCTLMTGCVMRTQTSG